MLLFGSVFETKASLCNHAVLGDQAGLELGSPLGSAWRVLGLQLCSTTSLRGAFNVQHVSTAKDRTLKKAAIRKREKPAEQ